MKLKYLIVSMSFVLLVAFIACKKAEPEPEVLPEKPLPVQAVPKALYLPAKVSYVPDNNDYNDKTSKYNNTLKVEGDNVAIFWANTYGEKPAENADASKRFNPDTALVQLERFYNFYVDSLKFVEKGKSLTDQYKMLTYVVDGTNNTAFGGGVDNKIGVLWTPASRIKTTPYGVLAHELGHSFQYMVKFDGAWGFSSRPTGSKGQTIFEMTSQYMLWQVYPQWMTFENYHLVDFLKQTHLAFLHEDNQYHSPYVLEYWSNKHGIDFVGKIWRSAIKGEDAVMTYKRLNAISQRQFNDEIFDASRRFVTWDMKRIEQVAKPYANKHFSTVNDIGNGWYRIAVAKCPQNYGYNAIKLQVPAAGTAVTLNFKGVAGAQGYNTVNADKAGWRYGFVAVKQDGSRVYSDTFSNANGNAQFTVPANTAFLWLVVSGAPTEHWEHIYDADAANDEQWPYEIKLSGTAIDNAMIK